MFELDFDVPSDTKRVLPRIQQPRCSDTNFLFDITLSSQFSQNTPLKFYDIINKTTPFTVAWFQVVSQQMSPQLSGLAEFDIDYVRRKSPDAVGGSDTVLSETTFALPLILVDSFGNSASQHCCINCFMLNSNVGVTQTGAAFNQRDNVCDVYVQIELNSFKQKVKINASYLGEDLGAMAAEQPWYNEIQDRNVVSQVTIKTVKDEQWTVWVSIVVGVLLIVGGVTWFVMKFERGRKIFLKELSMKE